MIAFCWFYQVNISIKEFIYLYFSKVNTCFFLVIIYLYFLKVNTCFFIKTNSIFTEFFLKVSTCFIANKYIYIYIFISLEVSTCFL